MQSIGAGFSAAAKAVLALGSSLGLSLGLSLGASAEAEARYDVKPGEVAGKRGSIIRVWPLEGGGPGAGDAFRILYRSTGLNGAPIAVSGGIFLPPGTPPAGGPN